MMIAGCPGGPGLVAHPLGCAVVSVINERGYELATVEDFLGRAGISREEFDREFSGKADVTQRVMEAFIDDFRSRVEAAYRSAGTWPENLRAAAYEAALWLTENPRTTRFGMVSSVDAGDKVRGLREEIFLWCASLIEDGRAVAPDPGAVPPTAAIIAIGAVAETLRRQQEGSLEADTVAAVPELMFAAVRPYLGEDVARRELEVPPPPDLPGPDALGGRLEGRRLFGHPLGEAVMEVLAERGYRAAGVEEFLERAGVSRKAFDGEFDGKADVTLRVYEAFVQDFVGRVQRAYDAALPWPASLRAAAYEVTRWMRDHPAATRFGNVGILEAEELGRVRREELFRWCAGLIDAGRQVAPDPAAVPASAALLAVGSVVEISRRHQEGDLGGDPVAMVPELMFAAVRPYLGEDMARRELEVPPPSDLATSPDGGSDD